MSASDYWEYANSDLIKKPGTCNRCDADTHEVDPPAAAPPDVDKIIVCEGCGRVVDAR